MVGIKKTTALEPDDRPDHLLAPKADMLYSYLPILPEHIWRTRAGVGGRDELSATSRRSSAAARSSASSSRRALRAHGAQPVLLGQAAGRRRDRLRDYQNADTMAPGPQGRRHRRRPGAAAAQFTQLERTPGIDAIAYNYHNWDYLNFNCYDRASSPGNPVLRDPAFRRRSTTPSTSDKLVPARLRTASPSRPRPSATRTRGPTPTTTGSRRPTSSTPSTSPRPTSCSTRPATHEGRRRRAETSGKPIALRLCAHSPTTCQEQTRGQAHRRLVQAARPEDQLRGDRHRR